MPVLLVTEKGAYREALAAALGSDGRLAVVATAASGEDALAAARRSRPGVVLLDLPMPEALATVRGLLVADADVKVIAYCVNGSEREVLAWAEAGIAGCIAKDGELAYLVDAAERAWRGETVCSPCVAGALFRRVAAMSRRRVAPSTASHLPRLTSREIEIFQLVARGLSNKEIARVLCLQPSTVKNHVHSVFEKLGIHRRADVAKWADLYGARGDGY